MSAQAAELEQVFDQHFPLHLQEALIRVVFSAYRTAFTKCLETLPWEEAVEFLPYERYIQLRGDLRRMGERFPEIHAEYNRYYTLVEVGPVRMTASSIPEPGETARYANYRHEFTQSSQLDLFLDNPDIPPEALMYVMLLHGPDRARPQDPLFAEIVFPRGTGIEYAHRINLFSRFSPLVETLRSETIQAAAPAATEPELRIKQIPKEQMGA